MSIRPLSLAPQSMVPAARRGAVQGTFCKGCGTVFPLHLGRHVGKGINGHDHIASPCSHEGEAFGAQAPWWEPAVIVLPAPLPVEAPAAAVTAAR